MGTFNVYDPHIPSAQYAYQVVLGLGIGLGIGLALSSVLIADPTVIKDDDTGMSYLLSSFLWSFIPLMFGLRYRTQLVDTYKMFL